MDKSSATSDGSRPRRLPVGWKTSVVRSFCEVPLLNNEPFHSIEIQEMEHEGRRGHAAYVRLPSGQLEIYVERHLALPDDWAHTEPATAHQDVKGVIEIDFDQIRCIVKPQLLDVAASFEDSSGRKVEIAVRHKTSRSSKPLFTPAPPHTPPRNLRFLIMGTFRLLPRSASISIKIDGIQAKPDSFLLPPAVAPFYSARIGCDLLLTSLRLVDGDDEPEIRPSPDGKALRIGDDGIWFEARFEPPLRTELDDKQSELSGAVEIHSSVGVVAQGKYKQSADGDASTLALHSITQDWDPGWRSPSRLILRQLRRRRRSDQVWDMRSRESAS